MNSPARRLEVAAAIGAALLAFGLSGCDQSEPASPPAPVPAPSAGRSTGPVGSEGLTVRYLGADGKIQTLDVEDFPR